MILRSNSVPSSSDVHHISIECPPKRWTFGGDAMEMRWTFSVLTSEYQRTYNGGRTENRQTQNGGTWGTFQTSTDVFFIYPIETSYPYHTTRTVKKLTFDGLQANTQQFEFWLLQMHLWYCLRHELSPICHELIKKLMEIRLINDKNINFVVINIVTQKRKSISICTIIFLH